MSNNKTIKKVFEEELGSEKIKQQILLKYERREKNKMNKTIKYAIIFACIILVVFLGNTLNMPKDNLVDNAISTMKIYAYTMSEEEIEKTELKDHVQLGLASYNLAISSVPGYPMMFELNYIDFITIEVTDGTILDWEKETGVIKNLGSTYQLSENGTLYFNINENTNIKINGMKDQKEVFEKKIMISKDDDFNYYATME